MPHHPKPFHRKQRDRWYVEIDGRQVNLGRDRDSAFATYHRLMAQRGETPAKAGASQSQPAAAGDMSPLVVCVIDDYLDWCQKHRAADTYRWYKDRLTLFCRAIPSRLTLDRLKPHHVQQWVDNHTALKPDGTPRPVSDGTLRNLIAAVKRAMTWAEEQGFIDRSPLAHLKKPSCGRREKVVTAEQYQALLDRTPDACFRDLLTVHWETGCRPQESLRVEARHVDVAGSRWVLPASESKGKKKPRVVYLTPEALGITVRLMERYPDGPLFRNADGRAWTPDATNCRFQRAKKQLGFKVCLYDFRHGYINRLLLNGVDAFTVATIVGHQNAAMLAAHYSHLSQAPQFLLEQARKAA
jgi:integrase